MVVVLLRKCRDLGPPWNRGEAAFLLVHGQKHYRAQLLTRPTGFLPTMFDERQTLFAHSVSGQGSADGF